MPPAASGDLGLTGTGASVVTTPRRRSPRQDPLSAPLVAVPDPRRLPRVLPTGGTDPGLAAHFDRWGHLRCPPSKLIAEVDAAGLQGRGGAGFPTAVKLRAVAAGRRSVVVVNGTEGEPASQKDKVLLAGAPHLVLDGASMAARAVGAKEIVLCVDRSNVSVVRGVRSALSERRRAGIDDADIRVETTPKRYLTGEESALVAWLNGGEAKPTFTPPRPFESGVGGRPTLINNAETLAHLALIARYGAQWYRALGSIADPGTALLTISGHVARPGVYESPLTASVVDLVANAGGSLAHTQAVLVGGYFGTWMPAGVAAAATLGGEALRKLGASLGAGVIVVLPPDSCGLVETARVTRWMADQSAGQCGPCANGLPAVAAAMDGLVLGDRSGGAEQQLHRWMAMIEGRGACRHPDGTVRFVRSALRVFAGEIDVHRHHGRCSAGRACLPTPVTAGTWR